MSSLNLPPRPSAGVSRRSATRLHRYALLWVALVLLLAVFSVFVHLVSAQVVRGAGVRDQWLSAVNDQDIARARKRDLRVSRDDRR